VPSKAYEIFAATGENCRVRFAVIVARVRLAFSLQMLPRRTLAARYRNKKVPQNGKASVDFREPIGGVRAAAIRRVSRT